MWMKVVRHHEFRQREKARVRKQKSREKLCAAAKRGDVAAMKKQKAEEEATRTRSALYASKRRGEKRLKKEVKERIVQSQGQRKRSGRVTSGRRRKKQRKNITAI